VSARIDPGGKLCSMAARPGAVGVDEIRGCVTTPHCLKRIPIARPDSNAEDHSRSHAKLARTVFPKRLSLDPRSPYRKSMTGSRAGV